MHLVHRIVAELPFPADLSMSLAATVSQQDTMRGIAWMVLTGLLFVCVTVIVRYLGSDMPAIEAAFIRYFIGLVMITPVLFRLRPKVPRGRKLGMYAARGLVHGIAVMLWFYAMARIPIAEVTALGYTSPIFVTIGAAMFLGERLQLRRVLAVLAGFAGAIIILRPGFAEISLGQLAQLMAAPLFAVSFIFAKKLTADEDPAFIVYMLSVGCTLVLLPGAIYQWRTPSMEEVFWLTMTAVFATAGHYTLTKAFRAAPITVTQPIGFLQLVWAALLGLILFGEELDPFVFLGAGVIIGAATYISHREAVAARQQYTPPATATKV
jgi:drug/metabolite transporter (DMT)-like permease